MGTAGWRRDCRLCKPRLRERSGARRRHFCGLCTRRRETEGFEAPKRHISRRRARRLADCVTVARIFIPPQSVASLESARRRTRL